jgi:hypothetical protein
MKTIILIVLFLTSCFFAKGQAAVVTDPGNTAVNMAIRVLSEGSQKLQDFLAKAEKLKLAVDIMDEIESVKAIAALMDDLACLTTEFKYYKNIDQHYSCATFLSYNLISFNINYVSDLLSKVIIAKNIFTMASSERLANLETIRKTLENTIKEIQAMNIAIRTSTTEKLVKKKILTSYYSSQNMSFNRYSKQ